MPNLSPYEEKLFNMITEGFTAKQIAQRMNTTYTSVRQAITFMIKKNGCRSAPQLVALVLRETFCK